MTNSDTGSADRDSQAELLEAAREALITANEHLFNASLLSHEGSSYRRQVNLAHDVIVAVLSRLAAATPTAKEEAAP